MRTATSLLLATALLAAGCGSDDEPATESPMAMDHSSHQHGATQGATDSTGAVVRQMVYPTAADERALGITYTRVTRQSLSRRIRTVGTITVAEPRVSDVTPKIDGFVEELFVDRTGATVQEGTPLLTLYSPALVAAQEELLTARRLADRLDPASGESWEAAQAMLDAARRRLAYWDITDGQIAQIEESGVVIRALTLVAPRPGVVLEKDVLAGQRVMAGQRLYRIADLSEVWIEGDVFEQDLRYVTLGSMARIEVDARPGSHVTGRVSFVYPTLDPQSRTARVRVTTPNRDGRLMPGMFATVFVDALLGTDVLAVLQEAVVMTGERDIVFVRHDDGSLMAHDVTLGARAGDMVEILSGVPEGSTVVASANFLVDAESRLGTMGGAMAGMDHGAAPAAPAAAEHQHD